MGSELFINPEFVTEAILATAEAEHISPLAVQEGARLVEPWVEEFADLDNVLRIRQVEHAFFHWLDTGTLLIGVNDLDAEDAEGPLLGEWKSAKEPQKNKDGSDSAYWNEDVWATGLREGSQLAFYALVQYLSGIAKPRVLVRAAVKSNPVKFWGDKVFTFEPQQMESVKNSLLARSTAIRAMQKAKLTPWAIIGNHCTNRFRRQCPRFKDCSTQAHAPTEPKTMFSMDDPGSKALVAAGVAEYNPEIVIFSASSLDASQQCLELYRTNIGGYYNDDAAYELQVGTVMHAGLASVYRQIKEHQNAG